MPIRCFNIVNIQNSGNVAVYVQLYRTVQYVSHLDILFIIKNRMKLQSNIYNLTDIEAVVSIHPEY